MGNMGVIFLARREIQDKDLDACLDQGRDENLRHPFVRGHQDRVRPPEDVPKRPHPVSDVGSSGSLAASPYASSIGIGILLENPDHLLILVVREDLLSRRPRLSVSVESESESLPFASFNQRSN